MPKRSTLRLTRRIVAKLKPADKDAIFWDGELLGFGVRVHATGRKIYVAQARTPGGPPKRGVIGRYVEMTTEEARRKAAEIVDRIRRGEDPVPPPPEPEATVTDLAERFMTAHVEVNCRPLTVEACRQRASVSPFREPDPLSARRPGCLDGVAAPRLDRGRRHRTRGGGPMRAPARTMPGAGLARSRDPLRTPAVAAVAVATVLAGADIALAATDTTFGEGLRQVRDHERRGSQVLQVWPAGSLCPAPTWMTG